MSNRLIKWFQSPTFPGDEDKSRSALILNVVLNTFLVAFPIIMAGIAIGNTIERRTMLLTILTVAELTIFGTRLIMCSGRVVPAGIMTLLIIFVTTTMGIYTLGTIRAPATSFYLLCIVLSGLVVGRRALVWTAGISSIAIITFLMAELKGLLPPANFDVSITQGITFVVIFTVISVLLYIAVRSIDEALSRTRQEVEIRKQAEAEMKRINEQLELRNAELERFNYTISHELKSPIVTVKAFLGSIVQDLETGDTARAQQDLARISIASDKMQKTISDLLELSRVGRIINPFEAVDMQVLIQEALETVQGQLKSHGVNVNVTSQFPRIYGDRIRLREVFENLLDNAAKYMGDQATPTIEIGIREGKGNSIFFVKDNGIGIEAPYREKIFGLFEKLDSTVEGTGVGLALIKRIIESHGGKIWVESDGPGKGSKFCFTIPDQR